MYQISEKTVEIATAASVFDASLQENAAAEPSMSQLTLLSLEALRLASFSLSSLPLCVLFFVLYTFFSSSTAMLLISSVQRHDPAIFRGVLNIANTLLTRVCCLLMPI